MAKTRRGIIGVDIGGTNIKTALVTGQKIIRRARTSTRAERGLKDSLSQIIKVVEPLCKDAKAIGIGIAGIIDSEKGTVKYSPNLKGWKNVPLGRILRAEFNLPVYVLNDVNAICLGEWKYGAGRRKKNVFLFTMGTGVGGGAICEGKLLFGAHGFAGEFGHTTIKLDGPKCTCGHSGHVERYAGAKYIVARARRKMAKRKSSLAKYDVLTPEKIACAAKSGDTVAREVFAEVGFYIGVGVANVIALFDPDIIIIAGGIAQAGRILFEPVRRTVSSMALGAEHRRHKIAPAQLGDDAGILGAALYAKLTIKGLTV
ncbi:MAG: ROK family protein [candidate division WOR-3 bacterium]|nr:MAG: ROK family protein [candidate division WOR-3 bacterium]